MCPVGRGFKPRTRLSPFCNEIAIFIALVQTEFIQLLGYFLSVVIQIKHISTYLYARHLDPASAEMEKRTVVVIHEILLLCVLKRMTAPILGKLFEDFRFPNEFPKTFTRYPRIFYLYLKSEVETTILQGAGQERIDEKRSYSL